MTPDTDVTIIGGGPAGLAAALTLGRSGVAVTLLERLKLPVDKVCGEGLMPPGLQFLQEVGAAPLISADDYYPFAGIRYHAPSGASVAADFEAGPGRGIRRTALADALRQIAAACPSVSICEDQRATGLQRRGDLMEVSREGASPLTSRLVVGADGLRSRVRRWAGLEGAPTRRPRFGVRQHYRCAPWTRYVEVYAGPALEAYTTPCGPARVGVAILWDPKRCPWAESGSRLFPSLLARIPPLQERLAGVTTFRNPRSTGPFEQRTTGRITDGVALVGDASGYLDPCTGEGLTLAFKQVQALAHCVVPALQTVKKATLLATDLRPYELAWRKIVRPYFFCTRFMLLCQRHPGLFERFVRLASRRPDLLRHFISFNMGTAPLLPGVRRAARWFLPPRSSHAKHP